MARSKLSTIWFRLLVAAAALLVVAGGVVAFRAGPPPTIDIAADLPGIGRRTTVEIHVQEPSRGLTRVEIEFVQGERVEPLAARDYEPLEPWEFWGRRTRADTLSVAVGSEVLQGLREGPAAIRVRAARAPGKLRHPAPARQELALEVKLRPPTLQVTSTLTYVAQGGCEAVVYRVGESAVADGVRSGEWWFPGYPLPGGDGRTRFALFGVPFDLEDEGAIRLVARDDVNNEATAAFVNRFIRKPAKRDTIRLSESFMSRVVPSIMAQNPQLEDRGTLLDNYRAVNGDLRAENALTLVELAGRSVPDFLWKLEFMQMRNAAVMSGFADRRTYTFEGRVVDRQDHLGIDLASTRMAPIQAANTGVVVLARYLGIYGNAVVIDHGYGLMSLYGHLSSLSVEEGQQVERGQEIGRSGATGLAGGDHLHFTMLLRGLSVDPREWWDDHWIHDRLKLKLGDALPFGS